MTAQGDGTTRRTDARSSRSVASAVVEERPGVDVETDAAVAVEVPSSTAAVAAPRGRGRRDGSAAAGAMSEAIIRGSVPPASLRL